MGIGEKLSNNDFNLELKESVEKEKVKEEKAAIKLAYSHVKTPDEVDDLPEHEVAPHDDVTYDDNLTSNREADNRDIEELDDNANDKEKEENIEQLIADACIESKIAKDEKEKEQIDKEDLEVAEVKNKIQETKKEINTKDQALSDEGDHSDTSAEAVKGEEEVMVQVDRKEIEKDQDSVEYKEDSTEKYTKETLEKNIKTSDQEDSVDGEIEEMKNKAEISQKDIKEETTSCEINILNEKQTAEDTKAIIVVSKDISESKDKAVFANEEYPCKSSEPIATETIEKLHENESSEKPDENLPVLDHETEICDKKKDFDFEKQNKDVEGGNYDKSQQSEEDIEITNEIKQSKSFTNDQNETDVGTKIIESTSIEIQETKEVEAKKLFISETSSGIEKRQENDNKEETQEKSPEIDDFK